MAQHAYINTPEEYGRFVMDCLNRAVADGRLTINDEKHGEEVLTAMLRTGCRRLDERDPALSQRIREHYNL